MTDAFEWQDGGRRWRVPFDRLGGGPPLLCLPAPSTISTRQELRGVAERLAPRRTVFRSDWPGFGDAESAPIRYRAPLFARFLAALLARFPGPIDVIAAGHAAGYALEVARAAASGIRRLVLLAPTWRGPLPTALGQHPRAYRILEALMCAPIVGPPLYAINASRPFVRWMMQRHVYRDPAHITDEVLEHRVRIAHRQHARFAAAAVGPGALDLCGSREPFLEAARERRCPLFVAIGDGSPPKSLAEMLALAALDEVRSVTLPGSLAFYDEYPEETATAVSAFLDGVGPTSSG